jgi:hypothetical protein
MHFGVLRPLGLRQVAMLSDVFMASKQACYEAGLEVLYSMSERRFPFG